MPLITIDVRKNKGKTFADVTNANYSIVHIVEILGKKLPNESYNK